MKNINKIILSVALFCVCLQLPAQAIRGVNPTIEGASIIIRNDITGKNERIVTFIGLCEQCPEQLMLPADALVSDLIGKSIPAYSLQLNTTYTTSLISYREATQTAYNIILSKGY